MEKDKSQKEEIPEKEKLPETAFILPTKINGKSVELKFDINDPNFKLMNKKLTDMIPDLLIVSALYLAKDHENLKKNADIIYKKLTRILSIGSPEFKKIAGNGYIADMGTWREIWGYILDKKAEIKESEHVKEQIRKEDSAILNE